MQTFFNPTTPFFDGEGKLLVGARVSFLDLETNASLIDITDSAGTPLPNPLFTGSDGRLRLENGNGAPAVPCIADGMSYKVVVARRTGVEPVFMGGILQNPGELYENPYIAFVVTSMGGAGAGANTSVVGSVAEVRAADKNLGSVVCSGYYEAGDCPVRVFTWVESVEPPQDNGINILRNPEDGSGYWKMSDPPAGTWDVRMAGLKLLYGAAAQNTVCLQNLLNVVNELTDAYTRTTKILFPKGTWFLTGGFSSYSKVVFAFASQLSFLGTSDKTVKFYGGIESYGGEIASYRQIFHTPDGDALHGHLRIECGQGTFRTSWLGDCKVSEYYPKVEDVLIIDSDFGSVFSPRPIARKIVVQADSTHNIIFTNCEIECDGKLSSSVAYQFKNCNFSDRFFKDHTFSDDVVLSGCRIDIDDFSNVDNWAKASLKNGATELDFKGRSCNSLVIRAPSTRMSYKVLNGSFSRLTFSAPDMTSDGNQANSIELFNCKVGFLGGDWLWNNFTAVNCSIGIGSSRYEHGPLDMSVDGLLVKGNVEIKGSDIYGHSNSSNMAVGCTYDSYIPSFVSVSGSRITGNVNGLSVDSRRSIFTTDSTASLKQWDANGSITLSLCYFSGNIKAVALGKTAYIVSNQFYTTGLGIEADSLTSCVYEGNVGNCLKKSLKKDVTSLVTVQGIELNNVGICLFIKLYDNEINLPLWGIGNSRILVKFIVTTRHSTDAQTSTAAENSYHSITASVVYETSSARIFAVPKKPYNGTIMDAVEGHDLVIAVPDGIDVSYNGQEVANQEITSVIVEAEILE